jgi:regulator of sigma E protease
MDFFGAVGGAAGSLLGYLVPFLAVLTVVVFIHELGHFLVGRWCGVGVNAFSIGFGPELFGWNDRHGTRWKLSAIPLGGYVKFAGDTNGASVPDPAALAQMSDAERAVSFHHKSVARRTAIVAAGPIANFLLAIAIFSGITYFSGRQILSPRIDAIQPGSAAERAGFKPGDLVLSINGRAISSFTDMQRIISASADDTLTVRVERQGQELTIDAVPDLRETNTPFGKQRIGLRADRVDPARSGRDLVRRRAHLHLHRAPRGRPRVGRSALGTDPDRASLGPGRESRRGFRARQPGGGAVRVDRADQPLPRPSARWRAPDVLRDRGVARPRA